jgi:hypothetical protein
MLIISGTTPESGTDTVSVTESVESPSGNEIVFCLECRLAGGELSGSEIFIGGEVAPNAQVYVVVRDNEGHQCDIPLYDEAQTISVIVPTTNTYRAAALAFNRSDLEH